MNTIESPEIEQEPQPRNLAELRELAPRLESQHRQLIEQKANEEAFELENHEPIEALKEFIVEIRRFFDELDRNSSDKTGR
jgi:hypothetical protein